MIFEATKFPGVWLIALEQRGDPRGYFTRTYCVKEFGTQGLHTAWPQCNETLTARRGSVRGMHWQSDPHGEVKLVRCTQGRVWDVVVDIRPDSATFGQWQSFELSPESLRQLYIPTGFAHGFQTLTENAVLHYQMGEFYQANLAAGFQWSDPAVGIEWPLPVADLSERDAKLPPLAEAVRDNASA